MLYDDLSSTQREVYHALNSLGHIGKMIVAKHGDMEVFQDLRDWSVTFATWVVASEILSEDEMTEVMEFGCETEKQAQTEALGAVKDILQMILESEAEGNSDDPMVMELEALFNAPSFENEKEDSSDDSH